MVYCDDDALSYKNQGNKDHDSDYSGKPLLKDEMTMTKNGKIVLITNTIALLIIIAFEIAGYTTPEWVIAKTAGGVETSYGLWQSCKDSPTKKKMCVATDWDKLIGYHMAGFVLMTMSLMMGFLGCSLVLILYCIKDQEQSKLDLCCRPVVKLKMTVVLLLCSSAMIGVAAVGFFCITYISYSANATSVKLGYSSILILVGSILTIPVLIGFLFGVTYHQVEGGGRGGSRYDGNDDRDRKEHGGPASMNPYDETYCDIPDSYGGFAEGGSYGGVANGGSGYPPMTPVAMMMPRTPVQNSPTTPGYYPY